jgi:hydrogenase nickel incorporation protein HypA/HybF
MHELGITRNIIAIVSEHARGERVKRVRLEIGHLSAILPDAIRFCFDVCRDGTLLAAAELEIDEIPGRGRCEDCGNDLELAELYGECACGSHNIRLFAGQELNIKEMETF